MKYIKLFEEFDQDKYILINELPDGSLSTSHMNLPNLKKKLLHRTNGIAFTGSDQLRQLVDELEKVGWKYTFVTSKENKENSIKIADDLTDTILWLNIDTMKCHYLELKDSGIVNHEKVAKFEDFFKENPTFHGYHSGRKFKL